MREKFNEQNGQNVNRPKFVPHTFGVLTSTASSFVVTIMLEPKKSSFYAKREQFSRTTQ